MENVTKPKLVFFRSKPDHTVVNFVLLHRQQQVKCLSEFFNVTVINEDCDYQQICEKYEPDLALFESGVNNQDIHRLNIKNPHTHPMIPKIGFHNGDPWCEARTGFLSDMDEWGIETFFSISCTIAEHMPEIADNLFVWPNFIDADIYRDYQLPKTIPVLITGGVSPLYPWRQRVSKLVTQHFPSLICPHGGYIRSRSAPLMLYGEEYSRLINTSWLVPTCGTLAKEILRKHFEIPGSKSCLVTEESPALKAAGFVDQQNCVFADEQDVLDKLDYLFHNQDKLERITDAGYNLVHSRHTLKRRDQILQWFNLYKKLQPNQKIIQNNPFDSLTIVEKSSGIKSLPFVADGLDISLLQQGDHELWAGQYEQAEITYIKCFNYMSRKPETKFKLSLCNLYKGNVTAARNWIFQPIQYNLADYKASKPDPVEWAYYAIMLLCLGKLNEAQECVNHFPSLNHPELNRTRWVVNFLVNGENIVDSQHQLDLPKQHYSIHQLPHRSFEEWIKELCKMLNACGQEELAERLTSSISLKTLSVKKKILKQPQLTGFSLFPPRIQYPFHLSFFMKLWFLHLRKQLKLKPKILSLLNYLELRLGYFLPYSLSEIRNDEFFYEIQKLVEEEDVEKILIIGASAGKASTEAIMAGIRGKQNGIAVFCLNTNKPQFTKLKNLYINSSWVKFYRVSSSSLSPNEIENMIRDITQENKVISFDLILIDGDECNFNVDLSGKLSGARYVLLNGIGIPEHCKNHCDLLMNSSYKLVCQNPCLRRGYSIFKKDLSPVTVLLRE